MSMFGTPKPLASLSSGLLARKGHARPAMRPQGYIQLGPAQTADDLGWNDMGDEFPHVHQDFSQEPVPGPQPLPVEVTAPLTAPEPPVLRQRAALDEQFGVDAHVPVEAPAPRTPITFPDAEEQPEAPAARAPEAVPAPVPARHVQASLPAGVLARVVSEVKAKKSKAAFTLRLDSDRHLRLRLASAVCNQSAQQLVTEALDAFLGSLTEVDALARQLDSHG